AADPQNSAVHQADRPQRHLGGAGAARRDRVPGEVGRGQDETSVLQGAAGGFVMAPGEWTEEEVEDLKAAINDGVAVEEEAEVVDRADRVDEVIKKCRELGLEPKKRQS